MISRRLAACLAALGVWGVCAGAASAEARAESKPSALSAAVSSARFAEPLVPSRAPSAAEQQRLDEAWRTHAQRSRVDDLTALRRYLAAEPNSPWRESLFLNVGLLDYHHGHFTTALAAWEQAWQGGRTITAPALVPQVDRALGELLRMHARLGRADDVARLLAEAEARPIGGAATEMVTGAREGLWMMRHNPGVAYLCGPAAVRSVLKALAPDPQRDQDLAAYRAGPRGVSLGEVERLAQQSGLDWRAAVRPRGAEVPIPSIVHWKLNHYAAIVARYGDRFHVKDPTFGDDLWITRQALEAESSGYFLVPSAALDKPAGWRLASEAEHRAVHGMGYTNSNDPGATAPRDTKARGCTSNTGCAGYNMHEMLVSLNIEDTPVSYRPGRGPGVAFTLNYNHREASQPATFNYSNFGQKWLHNWMAFIQDDPNVASANVTRIIAGGGYIAHSGFNGATGAFAPETHDAAVLVRTGSSPVRYELREPDGSKLVYAASNGATSFPRWVFLSQKIDPQGNAVTLSYDAQMRLVSLTDATGRISQLSYTSPLSPLLITGFTDAAGRSAAFSYDASGRLAQIVDAVGIVSSFGYSGATTFINSMTTPYGTTSFSFGESTSGGGPWRWLEITDPRGEKERLESRSQAPGTSFSESPFPSGAPLCNKYVDGRNSFYWDKHVNKLHPGDYTKARLRHWLHVPFVQVMSRTLESTKAPLENRVWMAYPGQAAVCDSPLYGGTLDRPSHIARVHPNGMTQLTRREYNPLGNVTRTIDPAGRDTFYDYAPNGIDVVAVRQKTSASAYTSIAQATWNAQHRPLTSTDAAGRTTTSTWNAFGQPDTVTNAKSEVTRFEYNPLGYLSRIVNPLGATQASFTYDLAGNIASRTDSEGHTLTYLYDGLNRLTRTTWPNGSTEIHAYTVLDRTATTDRLGRTTQFTYNAVRDLTGVIEPLTASTSRTTSFGRYPNGALKTLTDANGNVTTWERDIQSRVTRKVFANGAAETYAYDVSGRTSSRADAMNQTTAWSWTVDDRLSGIGYANAVQPTPAVGLSWDPYFARITAMTDGIGSTGYAYHPPGNLGALQLSQQTGPWSGQGRWDGYDVLGRPAWRVLLAGTNDVGLSWTYDALGRVTSSQQGELGNFTHTYLGMSEQPLSSLRSATTPALGTRWAYDTNLADRRLVRMEHPALGQLTPPNIDYQIDAVGRVNMQQQTLPGSGTPTRWDYAYDNADRITGKSASQGGTPLGAGSYQFDAADNLLATTNTTNLPDLDLAATHSANALNQVAASSTGAHTYDANGNLTSDGQRSYRWDAEKRLVGMTHADGSTTSFAYDGLNRRALETESTGSVTRNFWCGQELCQVTDASNTVTRRHYADGEVVSGTPYVIGRDHLGSVVRVWDTQGNAKAASVFSPYGRESKVCAAGGCPALSQSWAGLHRHAKSGLYLATYRAYSTATGRWLSRDPIAEEGGVNLYSYTGGRVMGEIDPTGEFAIVGGGIGALGNLGWQLWSNGGNWRCVDVGEVVSWAAIGSGVGGIAGSAARLGVRAELGRWGSRGTWSNSPSYRVPHFHVGNAPGLSQHHLPYQAGQWAKNVESLARRGKLGDDAYAFADLGVGAVATGAGVAGVATAPGAGSADPCKCQ